MIFWGTRVLAMSSVMSLLVTLIGIQPMSSTTPMVAIMRIRVRDDDGAVEEISQ